MRIGVLKERKHDERRVALRPCQVDTLVKSGHEVYVERAAGEFVGYRDFEYEKAGAIILDQNDIYESASLLLKVKCPLEIEFSYLNEKHTLFAFLHFDENISPVNINRIVETGVTGIAYEWVQKNGCYPLLQPMSELTGAVSARKTMELLVEKKGLLGGSYLSHWPASKAMVIGVGHIGANAINVFLRNKYRLVVIDKNPKTLENRLSPYVDLDMWRQANVTVVRFDESEPEQSVKEMRNYLPEIDIVICAAVRRATLPKERLEFLITKGDVKMMQRNSIISDAKACTRDLIETCVATEGLYDTYVEEDVFHYNCDHVPSLVARTATELLTEATFPYVRMLAEKGFEQAVGNDTSLFSAVMCYRKCLTHEYSAKKKNMPFDYLRDMIG